MKSRLIDPFNLVLAVVIFSLMPISVASAARHSDSQLITAVDLAPLYRETITAKAPWSSNEMEITDIKAYPPKVWVPKGEVSFEVRKVSSSRLLGRVAMEVSIKVDEKPARTVRVCGKVEAYREVPCAAHDMRRGEILTASSITTARMPLSRMNNLFPDSPEKLVGMALKHSVRAGQVLTSRIVAPPVIVKRGAMVTILAQSPYLTIRVPGKAVQPGAAGDLIRVKNLQSRKEIVARVLNKRTVSVLF